MRKSLFFILGALLLCSHDLYVKMDSYFLFPNQVQRLSLYNGTFEKSENTITRDRMQDASMIVRGERMALKPEQWSDQDSTITQLSFKTGDPGTYVVGVATLPRNIELTAQKFNDYLAHDGVVDMLASRREQQLLDQDAVERYEKHVKAIFQVGEERTDDWKTVLGYPIEFVPMENPYDKNTGDTLEVQLLLEGKPLANQLVIAQHKATGAHSHGEDTHTHEKAAASHSHGGTEHSHKAEATGHSHDAQNQEGHTHTEGQQLRTNAQGIVTIDLPEDGAYYLRTIHMVNVASDTLTHESKWATLTFEITHAHNESTHSHDHEEGIPSYIFWIGSILLIGILFFVFRNKATTTVD